MMWERAERARTEGWGEGARSWKGGNWPQAAASEEETEDSQGDDERRSSGQGDSEPVLPSMGEGALGLEFSSAWCIRLLGCDRLLL